VLLSLLALRSRSTLLVNSAFSCSSGLSGIASPSSRLRRNTRKVSSALFFDAIISSICLRAISGLATTLWSISRGLGVADSKTTVMG